MRPLHVLVFITLTIGRSFASCHMLLKQRDYKRAAHNLSHGYIIDSNVGDLRELIMAIVTLY